MAEHAPNFTTLEVKDLVKDIRKKRIIHGVSFSIQQGEIFGFLGPNGSGKTTTIRMLVGLIRPTSGSVIICGHNLATSHNQALRCIGSIVENPELYSYMSGMENLEHFARMIPGVTRKKIDEVVERVDLSDRIHDKVKDYSLGMRQRLGIAQALLGDPRLLILDEPTNGLDPQGIKEMRAFIHDLAAEGMSVFISSHLLSEIQQMCNRVAIINNGRVIKVGHVDKLLDETADKTYWNVQPIDVARVIIGASPGVTVLPSDPDAEHMIVTNNAAHLVPGLIHKLVAEGVSVFSIERRKPTLEDLFLHITGGGMDE
ncbi:ABC transporter ATP-binding protein [Aneurinibacillus sp. Ricciae_BoGa-3]|uniref:ABC transporter ATP-binding protein n=1 Tax=Aneurinibacillus sp. Ricciae_BoGa-3 TaxID=3022697 RepID=UPI002340DD7E|nr:ABC transporter ATP-binding protein [Aneurinibacillus sp. Ricciae_BoGa-3]WCK55886.1 ABC transporter ATP-binding protein [Aneurinibacillus sp. Ricciae_BoGa-3]